MRKSLSLVIAAAFALTAAPALAQGKWTSNLTGEINTPLQIGEVSLGAELSERADLIGAEELQNLLEELREEVSASLGKSGMLSDNAATRINLTLADARPNHPTAWQLSGRGKFGAHDRHARLSRSANLSIRSVQLGRVKVIAEFVDASGASLGEVSYFFESYNIRDASHKGVWTDANRGIDRFARRLPGSLATS